MEFLKCEHCGEQNSAFNISCSNCGEALAVDESTYARKSLPQLPQPVQTLESGTRLAQFVIQALIGQGGMGTVYRALDSQLDRPVALKMLHHNENLNKHSHELLAEAKLASALNHRNIVTIFGVFQESHGPFIAMEWIEGQTLETCIPAKGLAVGLALDYAMGMANGLGAAHARGIIHRDIKPGNIMVHRDGQVKILDFGLAGYRPVSEHGEAVSPGTLSQTMSGFLEGTLPYMSPEQARGKSLDVRSDVFSFGVVLYQMLTGRRPFPARDTPTLLRQIEKCAPPSLKKLRPDLPPALAQLVGKCMSAWREQRPQTMSEVAESLKRIHTSQQQVRPLRRLSWVGLAVLGCFLLAWILNNPSLPLGLEKAETVGKNLVASLAVLPLENLTGDPSLDVFCDGFTAVLTSYLTNAASSQGPGSWILPATEVRLLASAGLPALARDYGVKHAVSGSMRYSADGYLVEIQLLNAQNAHESHQVAVHLPADPPFNAQNALLHEVFHLLGWQESEARDGMPNIGGEGIFKRYLVGQGYLYRNDLPGNLDRAEQAFQSVLQKSPDFIPALVSLGELYRMRWAKLYDETALDKALIQVNKALALRDDLAPTYNLLARIYMEQGAFEPGMNTFQRAIMIDPYYAPSWYGMARLLGKMGRVKEAEEAYQKASDLSPYNWMGQTEMSSFLFNRGQYTKVEPILRRLVKMAPGNMLHHSNLGICLYYLGRQDEAEEEVSNALFLKPGVFLYNTRGAIRYTQHRFEEAAEDYLASMALKDNLYYVHGNLADALRQMGAKAAAAAAYTQAIVLTEQQLVGNPESEEMLTYLALFLAKLGDSECLDPVLASLDEPTNSAMVYIRAQIAEITGDRFQALTLLEQALAANYPLFDIIEEPEFDQLRRDPAFHNLALRYPQ